MSWHKLTKGLGRGLAAAQIATQLATVPVTKDGTPDLVRQYAQYSKGVKLDNIHRRIRRDTTRTFSPVAVLDKRASKKLRGR